MSNPEPDVHLVLSVRAAKVLDKAISIAIIDEIHVGEESDILANIQDEIKAQSRGGKVKPKKKPKEARTKK